MDESRADQRTGPGESFDSSLEDAPTKSILRALFTGVIWLIAVGICVLVWIGVHKSAHDEAVTGRASSSDSAPGQKKNSQSATSLISSKVSDRVSTKQRTPDRPHPKTNTSLMHLSDFTDASVYGAGCKAYHSSRTGDPRWKKDLNADVDLEILDGRVMAYQIQWFNGKWSKSFSPGDGDVDWKTNANGSERRVWSYFFDHNFRFVLCPPQTTR